MRTLVAVLLLGAVGWGQAACQQAGGTWVDVHGALLPVCQQPSHQTLEKGPDAFDKALTEWEKSAKRLLATNRALTNSLNYCNAALNVCYKDVNEVSAGLKACSKEVDQPRLPLTVNPGECYRIGGDMSMHLIECP